MNKRSIAFFTSLAIAALTPVAAGSNVYAETTSSISLQKNYTDTLELYADDADDDPGYIKYYNNSKLAEVSSNGITHNSRFSGCEQTWGIDVSKYQGDINWSQVRESGIDYAIIRAGFRGYGTGTIVMDTCYTKYMQGAIEAGLDVGVYFYSQAINEKEAKEEADFVLKNIKNYDINCPVYIDMEDVGVSGGGRFDKANLTKAQKTAIADTFCSTILEAGYSSGIYANKYWLNNVLDTKLLEDKYQIWLAHYTSSTDYTGRYQTWQYTSTGTVNGITGHVDGDVHYVTSDDKLNAKFGNNSFISERPTISNTEESTDDQSKITYNKYIGDVNFDGRIDSKDSTLILKYFAETITHKETELTEEQVKNADVNQNGKVESSDATVILVYFAGYLLGSEETFGQHLYNKYNIVISETEETATDETEEMTEETLASTDGTSAAETDTSAATVISTDVYEVVSTEISTYSVQETINTVTE